MYQINKHQMDTSDVSPVEVIVPVAAQTGGRGRKKRVNNMLAQAIALLQKDIPDVTKTLRVLLDVQNVLAGKKQSGHKQPSKYNLFVKDTMAVLKTERPDMTNLQRMALCAQRWREQKIANAQNEQS